MTSRALKCFAGNKARSTAQGKIENGELLAFSVTMPANVQHADFRVDWADDWSKYPTSDIDLYVGSPDVPFGVVDFVSAGLDEPEIVAVTNPKPGDWYVYPFAFEVDENNGDRVKIRAILDGTVVKVAEKINK